MGEIDDSLQLTVYSQQKHFNANLMKFNQLVPGTLLMLSLLVFVSCGPEVSISVDSEGESGRSNVQLLFPGNWADPTVTKLGDTYYLTSNNDNYVPSILVFKSKDLKSWEPVGYASPDVGQGPATDIIGHGERLYIYGGSGRGIWVMTSEAPYREWTGRIPIDPVEPMPLDAGHVVAPDGTRYLYTAQGKYTILSGDGLKATTPPVKVYDGWPIPDEMAVECMCLESPKFFWRGEYCYLVSAQGGTAGPSTSHMAVVARAKHPEGPWENAPNNPVIRTQSGGEEYWTKGHATFIEDPEGNWVAIYHGYLQHQRSFGRSTLISPLEWTEEGWPVMAESWPEGWDDLEPYKMPLSDEFDSGELALQWQAYEKLERERYTPDGGSLVVKAVDTAPGSSNPLTVNPTETGYEIETELVVEGEAEAGLILFYNQIACITFGINREGELFKQLNQPARAVHIRTGIKPAEKRLKIRIRNNNQDVSYFYEDGDGNWVKLERSDDVSPYQHNIMGSFSSVRPGVYAVGEGTARFEYFHYKAI